MKTKILLIKKILQDKEPIKEVTIQFKLSLLKNLKSSIPQPKPSFDSTEEANFNLEILNLMNLKNLKLTSKSVKVEKYPPQGVHIERLRNQKPPRLKLGTHSATFLSNTYRTLS